MRKLKRGWFVGLMLGMTCLLAACVSVPVLPIAEPTRQSEPNVEPIALLLRVEGDVWLVESTGSGRGPGLMTLSPDVWQQTTPSPQPFQDLPGGTVLRMEAGSAVVIVCYNDRVYRVEGPSTISVTQETCNSGKKLPPGSAKRAKPGSNKDSKVLEGELRGDEKDTSRPRILSPRNSYILEMEPPIIWRAVTNTLEYRLDLLAMGNYETVVLRTTDIDCAWQEDDMEPAVCTYPWPASWPLAHGQRLFLMVSARQPNGLTTQSEESELQTLPLEESRRIETDIAEIESLGLDPVSQNLLLASLYVQENLYAEGITDYRAAQAEQPSALVAIALGDLYLAVDLPDHALAAYTDGIELLARGSESDPAYSAAAELGIGIAHLRQAEYETAIEHLTVALEFYRQVGATEEEALATAALEQARQGNSSD